MFILFSIMLRYVFYILPALLLVGAGCVIGNRIEKEEILPGMNIEADRGGTGNVESSTLEQQHNVDIVSDTQVEDSIEEETDKIESMLPELEVHLKSGNFFFEPPFMMARPGQVIRVVVDENQGLHTFVIDELTVKQQLKDGAEFTFIAPIESGDYPFYCDIGEHRLLGMEGVLRVQE